MSIANGSSTIGREFRTPYGQARGSNSLASDHGFLGQPEDKNGLVFLNARYYDPVLGRFASVDPAGRLMAAPGGYYEMPQALNQYSYGFDNPLLFMDPSGLWPKFSSILKVVAVVAVVAVIAVAAPVAIAAVGAALGSGSLAGAAVAASAVVAESGVAVGTLVTAGAAVTGAGVALAKGQNPIDGGLNAAGDIGLAADSAGLNQIGVQPRILRDSTDTIDLSLKYKNGWSQAQIAEADAKVASLNQAAREGRAVVTNVVRSGTFAASRYRAAGNSIPSRSDVDHVLDLQLGGSDSLSNMLGAVKRRLQ